MKDFKICTLWLLIMSILFTVMGLYMIVMGWMEKEIGFIDQALWPGVPKPDELDGFQSFMYGIYGAVATAMGGLLIFITWHSFRRQQRWARHAILLSLSVWFVLDTLTSIKFGMQSNAVNNAILFGLFLAPLLACSRYFKRGNL